jgi:outer membrane biosynthesis protein TonB
MIMKKILLSLAILSVAFSLKANVPVKETIEDQIRQQISYPEFAVKNQEEGFVMVSFLIDSVGNVTVTTVNSDNPTLKDYVVEQLENLKVHGEVVLAKEYNIRVEFRLRK